nr:hypothetical protein [Actinomyces provencensis]
MAPSFLQGTQGFPLEVEDEPALAPQQGLAEVVVAVDPDGRGELPEVGHAGDRVTEAVDEVVGELGDLGRRCAEVAGDAVGEGAARPRDTASEDLGQVVVHACGHRAEFPGLTRRVLGAGRQGDEELEAVAGVLDQARQDPRHRRSAPTFLAGGVVGHPDLRVRQGSGDIAPPGAGQCQGDLKVGVCAGSDDAEDLEHTARCRTRQQDGGVRLLTREQVGASGLLQDPGGQGVRVTQVALGTSRPRAQERRVLWPVDQPGPGHPVDDAGGAHGAGAGEDQWDLEDRGPHPQQRDPHGFQRLGPVPDGRCGVLGEVDVLQELEFRGVIAGEPPPGPQPGLDDVEQVDVGGPGRTHDSSLGRDTDSQ